MTTMSVVLRVGAVAGLLLSAACQEILIPPKGGVNTFECDQLCAEQDGFDMPAG